MAKHPENSKMPETVTKAYQYHLKGLSSKEIGKLLDTSPRSVQRWKKVYRFHQRASPKPIHQHAFELHKKGFSYREIAKAVGKSKTTIYYYIKWESEQQRETASTEVTFKKSSMK